MGSLRLAPRETLVRRSGDVVYLESPLELAEPPARLGDLVRASAANAPDRDFLLEREVDATSGAERIRRVTWKAAVSAAEGIATWLVRENPKRKPVLCLSGNSVDHALLMIGCFFAGIPFAPISPAYSLLSQDFAKLRRIVEKLGPGLVYAESRAPFERALAAMGPAGRNLVTGGPARDAGGATYLRELFEIWPDAALAEREQAVTPSDVAKVLFTSGSTGFPKGVPNTHRMLAANQQMIAQLWPFLDEQPPVLVDWLPWSHTFGGNHNLNMVLRHAGTIFVDQGKPVEALMPTTVKNLLAVSPTLYFNVPAGYAALVPRLEASEELRRAFFANLRVLFYAAAALPDDLWQRLRKLASEATERDVFLTTAWGSTETSPLATSAHFPLERAGSIGLPAPGVTLKLVPNGTKREVRVKGPSVMSGYLGEPELTKDAFDDEGFYRIGDAVRLADESDPAAGLLFDGRVAEDFKLSTGTWVSVGTLRTSLLAACAPALVDLVVAGQDQDFVAILAWPNPASCRALLGRDMTTAALVASGELRQHVKVALEKWNRENPETSKRVRRVALLAEPASLDAGEITDKGYVNQRATLERRKAIVAGLFGEVPPSDVIVL